MSSVKIQGSATGTAAFTIAVPAGTSTDRTINLPDAAGSFVLADGSNNVAVTGDLTVDTDTLHVDSTNNQVGIGDATPDRGKLQVHHYNSVSGGVFNSPHIALSFNASPTDNDAFGGITYPTSDSDNYGWSAGAKRTSAGVGDFVFTQHNNSATGTERAVITSDGNVGIGTSSPTGSGKILHLNSSTTVADLHMTNSFSGDTASDGFVLRYSGASAEFLNREAGSLIFYTSGTSRMTIDDAGRFFVPNVYASTTSGGANVNVASSGRLERSTSSLRYKNTINDATHGLTELLTLRPVTFKGNNDGDTVFGGLIAEEVHDAGLTEFVQYDEEDRPDALAYGNMVSLCIKAIQELNAKVEACEAKNTEQQALIEDLQTRLAALEAV